MDKIEVNEDLLYIKNFSKIKVENACKRLGIDKSNLWSGKTSKNNIKRVRRLIESDLAELYKYDEVAYGKRHTTL